MRDQRGRSPSPRPISAAVTDLRRSLQPETPLAAIESAWATAVGPGIAAVSNPVSEREGTLTVECESAVWAEELSLMEHGIRAKLSELIGDSAPGRIKFRT